MKNSVFVALRGVGEAVLARAELSKVLGGFGDHVGKKFYIQPANWLPSKRNVHKHYRVVFLDKVGEQDVELR